MTSPPRILIIDDNPEDRLLARRLVVAELPSAVFVDVVDAAGLSTQLASGDFDLVLTDFQIRWTDGIRVVEQVKRSRPNVPVVMFTDTGSEETAVAAMKAGLDDYVLKSSKHRIRLPTAVRVALEKRASETRFVRLEARLRGLLDRLDVGVFRLDRDGRLIDVNQTMLALLRLEPTDLARGVVLHDLAADPAEARALDEVLKSRGSFRSRELRLRRADGQVMWAKLSETFGLDADGAPVVEGLIEDVGERKRAEQDLVAAREAAVHASRSKTEFLADLSHEIRTPMNGVLGMVELLLDTQLDSQQRDMAETVRTSGRRLLALLDDVLDLSKFEIGKLELESAPFSLRGVMRDVERTLLPLARKKGLALSHLVEAGTPDDLVGDAPRISQVLLNLVGNAIKYTDHGSVRVEVGVEGRDGANAVLRFAVADTGIGIPEAEQASIFEAFVRSEAAERRKVGGSGLGLSISSRLVALMGGRIGVESVPGKGSTFRFTSRVRIGAPRTIPTEPLASDRMPRRGLRILLAEDDPVNCTVATGLLTQLGHSCAVVDTGRAAVAALEAERFDLVLMDVRMPEMDGFQATAAIRAREQVTGERVPILAVSAHAAHGYRERCLAAGMDGYVLKPVQPAQLAALIDELAPAPATP